MVRHGLGQSSLPAVLDKKEKDPDLCIYWITAYAPPCRRLILGESFHMGSFGAFKSGLNQEVTVLVK